MPLLYPAALLLAALPLTSRPEPAGIFGGTEVATCGWPNVVALGGACTGTLVHPRVVVYAAHCGVGDEVVFGDDVVMGPTRVVPTSYCGQFPREEGQLGRDWAYCVLQQPQLDIPIVPPLMGCELAQLTEGAEVVVVGFGIDEQGVGGIKRELVTTYHRIENDEAFIGGDGEDACLGDSGGPAFIRVPDPEGGPDTWRLFGIVSHGDLQCLEGTWYGLLHVGMDWLQTESDFDLTPCTDADGTWNPGPRCTDLPIELGQGQGQWPQGCESGARAGPARTCGEPFGFDPDEQPPVVTMLVPDAPLRLDREPDHSTAPLTIEIEASDGDGWGIDEVRLVIDGEVVPGGFDGRPPFEFEAQFPPGTFEISAIAVDLAGNEAQAEPVVVAIDEDLPPGLDAEQDGCACRSAAPGFTGLTWLWAVGVVARRRRRGG